MATNEAESSPDHRFKDVNWSLPSVNGQIREWSFAQTALLMDLRDELKRLNSLLHCHNFMAIPYKLDRISRNTAKPRRKKGK